MYRNVKAELTRQDMTQTELAEKLGVTLGTVSNWLNGVYPIPFRTAVKIKAILKVDMPLEKLFEEFKEVG